ncbi:MAG: diacylglycerol kinase [Actinomycetia bacterium]|nr:diacylglycerol kinase [Actinomycetes bacterium]
MTYRVVQFSTGNVGMLALRAIIEHPDLELVGLWVHSPDKVGVDAGVLAGGDAVGVRATDDLDAILALRADAVMHTATGDLRPDDAVTEMCRFLEAGTNVVSTSVVSLVHPASADPNAVARIAAACAIGSASCFTSGIDPGFANDLLPIVLSGFVQRIATIRVQEILNYATYMQPEVLFETMGFAKPLDQTPLLLLPGVLTFAWGGVVAMIAEALDVELDEIREVYERRATDTSFDIALGHVDAGTVAGLRFEVQGIVNDRPAIIVEHVTRIHDDVAPDWPQPRSQHGGYVITIEGEPNLECELRFTASDGDENTGGLICTAMRLLNAVPAVVAAPAGILSALDLPVVAGRHLLR